MAAQQQGFELHRPSLTTALFFVAGGWLALSPYLLGFSWHAAAIGNAIVIGIALMVLAVIRYINPRRFQGVRWTALILGGWLIASPFATDYYTIGEAMWNAVLVGGLVLSGAISAAIEPRVRATT